jgi:hypothetical protein
MRWWVVVKSGGRQVSDEVSDEVSGEQISLLFNAELMAENGSWARSPPAVRNYWSCFAECLARKLSLFWYRLTAFDLP